MDGDSKAALPIIPISTQLSTCSERPKAPLPDPIWHLNAVQAHPNGACNPARLSVTSRTIVPGDLRSFDTRGSDPRILYLMLKMIVVL